MSDYYALREKYAALDCKVASLELENERLKEREIGLKAWPDTQARLFQEKWEELSAQNARYRKALEKLKEALTRCRYLVVDRGDQETLKYLDDVLSSCDSDPLNGFDFIKVQGAEGLSIIQDGKIAAKICGSKTEKNDPQIPLSLTGEPQARSCETCKWLDFDKKSSPCYHCNKYLEDNPEDNWQPKGGQS